MDWPPLSNIIIAILLLSIAGCSKKPVGETNNGDSKTDSVQINHSNDRNRKVDIMNSHQILEAIKRKDWAFTEQQTEIEPAAAAQILSLLEDSDREVRELCLYALNNIGGQEARKGFLKAMKDENINVRSTACRFYMNNYDAADLQCLLQELETNEDEYVREHVVLAIGKIGNTQSVEPLKQKLSGEPEDHAKHAMHLALVRLKEQSAQDEYRKSLRQNDPRELARALKDFEYVRDLVFVNDIIPLLDDKRDALNVAPSDKVYYIRVCDVAVNVLDIVLEHRFTFEIYKRKRYSQEELTEAKNILRSLK